MRLIPLTKGKFAKVDDDDFEVFGSMRWYANNPRGRRWYAVRSDDGKIMNLHRAVMGVKDPGIIIDHINHDGLDCRKSNLRRCTVSQNLMNRSGPTIRSSSGIRGVSWDKLVGKWRVQVRIDGRQTYFGIFTNKIEAGRVARLARKKHYGEFAGGN